MDRTATDALSALNAALVARGGEAVDEWPVTFKGWSPVEQVWAFQPWVSPRGCFGRIVPCWWSHGALKWWGRDGHLHVWSPPTAIRDFVARFDAGTYPALAR
jgi:hypothetical protein